MFGLVRALFTRWGLATAASIGATGYAYTTSSAARAEDLKDGVQDGTYLADTLENTAQQAVGGVIALGSKALSAATGETAQGAIRTAHDLTTKTLIGAKEAAPAVGSALYNGAGTVAGAGISGAQAGYNGIYNFISDHILPKDSSGWLKTLAAVSASVLALWGGSKAIGFSAGESLFGKIAGAPMKIVEGLFGSIASGITTLLPLALVATAVGVFLSPTAREWIGNAFGGTKETIAGKDKSPSLEQGSPAQMVAASPVANGATVNDVAAVMPNVRGVNLEGITGGTSTHTVSLNRDQLAASTLNKTPDGVTLGGVA